ncbi:Hypothetical predicted protein, partial [Mytilus galloprovincialis]
DSRRSCTIYLRDPDIDVNDIIQKIDEIKEMIRRGDCAIALEGASIGSLKLHVTIHNKSFRTKEKLHTDIHLFLHEFFVAASIPFKQGHLYTVILAESDYLVEDNEKKKDLDYQKDKQSQVLKLNVNVKESAFQNKFVLYREVKSFIAGMYNVVTRPDVTLIGSARQVFMIADNDIGRDSTSSFRSMQDSKLRSQEPSVLQTVRSTRPEQVVAAIDFGTRFSGAAFSTKTQNERNPLNVESIQLDKQKSYYKTQTSILLSNKGFKAFGEQAEIKFKIAHLKGKADDLYFFRNFKMQLHGEKLSKSMKLRTIDGKEMSCITVFAACIEHIKEMAYDRIKEVIKDIQDNDIHWVLTVPAIWNEQARQFMIKAAEKVYIY